MPSLKNNLFYSILLVLANYVFPFLTYPYVSRVLGVTGIGACNFVDSVINYFILFSSLGIGSLGVREIARNKGDKHALDRTFSNLLLVNLALTGFMLVLLVAAALVVPQLSEHKDLMFIGAFKLVFNCLLVEWLFRGLEDFRFITIRTVAIKVLYVIAVFVFVRHREDVWIYYSLSSLTVVINALVNIVFSRTRVRLTFKNLELKSTFKSMLALGVYSILTSMYTTFNVTFLGFVSGETEVGYYYTATKVYYIVMAVFSAFTSVMLPRMSSLVSEGEMEKFKRYFALAVDLLLALSLPLVIWMVIMAPDIVFAVSGPEFGGSVIPMVIISPLLFVVGYEQILVLQTLLPLGKDKIMLRNSLIGAIVGVALNIILVPFFASIGSSVVWVSVECLILVLSQVAVTKTVSIRFPLRSTLTSVLIYLPLACLVALCLILPGGPFVRLAASVIVVSAYVCVYQLVVKKGELIKSLI